MKKPERSVLINPNREIDLVALDEIARSLLTFADHMYIQGSATVAQGDDAIVGHITSTLEDLASADLVRYYSLSSDPPETRERSTRLIDRREHMEVYSAIVGNVSKRETWATDNKSDPERTSRIVEARADMWVYGLAELLDADLSFSSAAATSPRDLQSSIGLRSEFVSQLFQASHTSPLWHLQGAEIVSYRKEFKSVRRELDELATQAIADPKGISPAVQREIEEQQSLVLGLATGAAGNEAAKRLARATALNVLSVLFSPVTALVCGADFITYFRNRKRFRFLLFMQTLSTPVHPAITSGKNAE